MVPKGQSQRTKSEGKLLYLERYESFSQKGGQNNSYTYGTKDYF
jgi:hypothetical protein